MARFLQILCVTLMLSCVNEPYKDVDFTKRVEALKTIEQKKNFLDSINYEFNYLKKDSESAILIYGLNSKTHQEKKKIFNENKHLQFKKIDAYLNTYGYPSIMEVGSIAAYAPYLITTNMDGLNTKKKNFAYFYDAYVFGNISDGLFYSYIADLYYLKTKNSHLFDPNEEIKVQIDYILSQLDYN